LNYHIEIEKLLSDLVNRIDGNTKEQEMAKFMIEHELLETYGDKRKHVW